MSNFDKLLEDSSYRESFRMTHSDVDRLAMEVDKGFSFFKVYDLDEAAQYGIDAHSYGQAFASFDYIESSWSYFGRVVEFGSAVPEWQDYAVLQKLE